MKINSFKVDWVLLGSSFAMLAFLLFFTTCNNNNPPPTPTNNTPAEFYFRAIIGGTQVGYEAGVNNVNIGYYNGSTTYDQATGYHFEGGSSFGVGANVGVIVAIGQNIPGNPLAEPQDVYNALSTGELGIDTTGNSDMTGGTLSYTDSQGQSWATFIGGGSQSGASFMITSIAPFTGDLDLVKVVGTLSCTLYDGNGNSMQVTNGEFSINIRLYA